MTMQTIDQAKELIVKREKAREGIQLEFRGPTALEKFVENAGQLKGRPETPDFLPSSFGFGWMPA